MNAISVRRFNEVLRGPEASLAGEKLRQEIQSKNEWPYDWSYPPPGCIRVTAGADSSGTLIVPTAAAGATQGLLYTVDEGFEFWLTHLMVIPMNSNGQVNVGPGTFTWSLTLNQPVTTTPFQGSPIQGFTAVDVPLGTLEIPWPLQRPELFGPNDQIRSVFTNVSLSSGAGNWLKTILLGWKQTATRN